MRFKEIFLENKDRRYCNITKVKKENMTLVIDPIRKIKENWIVLLGILVVIIGFLLINFNSKIFLVSLALIAFLVVVYIFGNKAILKCDKDLLYLKENLITEFDNFWNYEILKQEFLNTNTTYIVAKQNETIVGFAGILTIVDEANIMNIVTKKDKRNLGIGTLLLQNLIQISKEQNLNSVTLEVNEHNIPAIKLYEKFNFTKVGLRKKYYNNTDSAIIMTLYI
jgi:ribosomal-protein-alanine N-acetyltransferase